MLVCFSKPVSEVFQLLFHLAHWLGETTGVVLSLATPLKDLPQVLWEVKLYLGRMERGNVNLCKEQ